VAITDIVLTNGDYEFQPDELSAMRFHIKLTSLLLAITLAGCAALNPSTTPWNIKSISTSKYVNRINRSGPFNDLKNLLQRKGVRLAILDQDSDTAKGALAGIYADGLYYSFTDEDTARHIRERTGNLMKEVLGTLAGDSEWVVSYCIDFTNGTANPDMGYIRADLYYSLTRMSAAHFDTRPRNLQSCQTPPDTPLLYRRKVALTATIDGSKTLYTVVNPSKPLNEIERFDLILSDLTYQAAEVILTDKGFTDALSLSLKEIPDHTEKGQTTSPDLICRQLKIQPETAAFVECVAKLSH
jgi:hypothetical protein